MKNFGTTIIIILLAVAAWLSTSLYSIQQKYSEKKELYAEINKIDFGLFNLHAWRDQALSAFAGQISNFKIDDAAYDEVEDEFQVYLQRIYKDYVESGQLFEPIIKDAEQNEAINKFLLNLLKQNLVPQIKELNIPKYIPSMAKELTLELRKNEPRIKAVLSQELNKLLQYQDRYPSLDRRAPLFAALGVRDLDEANSMLRGEIQTLQNRKNSQLRWVYLLLIIGTFTSMGMYKMIGFNRMIAGLTLNSIVFLILGVTLPMIDIDARLNSFVFALFNEDITFGEQTLFYQSKSIIDVTRTLLEGRGIDLKIVGLLILCFSVVFPLIKLVLSVLYLNIKKLQSNQVVKSFIFHLGKWSMADVFVVALFMAYIGFYGLVDGNLRMLEQNRGGFGIETVNYSGLAPGALFFTSYCIISIMIGVLLNRRERKRSAQVNTTSSH
jgi:hypothetical protein